MNKNNKSPKIAFLGNMNNNHFALSRYLRDLGYDVDLLLYNNEYDHFHPSVDTYSLEFRNWVKRLRWGSPSSLVTTSRSQIARDLDPYDILIGCGFAASFCRKASRRLDIFIPYGGDIWDEINYRLFAPHKILFSWIAVFFQRRSLSSVRIVHAPPLVPSYEKRISRFCPSSERWLHSLPMVHHNTYKFASKIPFQASSHWLDQLYKIRDSVDFLVIAHSRHVWGTHENLSAKGNDILINGWAQFHSMTPSLSKCLILVEYGVDVVKSIDLTKTLSLDASVCWLPKLYRKDIMPAIALSDLVAGQFVHPHTTCGVIYEALSLSKPVLTFRDLSLTNESSAGLYPVYNASTEQEIRDQLIDISSNPDQALLLGRQGGRWYQENVVKPFIETYTTFLG